MTKKHLLLFFAAICCAGCQEEDYGGYYPTYCNGTSTTIRLKLYDYLSKAPLDSLHFNLVENDSSFLNPNPGPIVLTELVSTAEGDVSWTFTHSTAQPVTYFIRPLPDNDYFTTAIWNVPAGCETVYDAPMKKAMPAILSITNNSAMPLIDYSVLVSVLPRYRSIGIVGYSLDFLDFQQVDTIQPNETKLVMVKSLPDELLGFYSSYTLGINRLNQRDSMETRVGNYQSLSIKL